jgi:plasmid stabilization system protein ParE
MSSRKTYSLSLSDEAIEDFRDILSYTMQMWGERQVEEYATILHKALTAIEQTPHGQW